MIFGFGSVVLDTFSTSMTSDPIPAAFAAIYIGGTKMAACIATANGPLLRVTQSTLTSGTPDSIARQGLRMIESCCRQLQIDPAQVQSVGVSSCGPFELRGGAMGIIPPSLCGGMPNGDDLPNDWTYLPLESVLRERFATVRIANDCVAALHGERAFGIAPANAIYVTWSTGIGFGLCVDGHILNGKAGNAGHAGHMLLSETSDALCSCGNRGDLEGMIGGRNFGKHLGKPLETIFADAKQGNAAALQTVQAAARWLGRALYNLTAILDTEAIFIGGSVWRHNEAMLAPTVQSATLGELVTDMGALALVVPPSWSMAWRASQPWKTLRSVPVADSG